MIGMVVFFGRVGNLCSDVKEVEHKPIKMVLIEVFFSGSLYTNRTTRRQTRKM
jgi:hypothetical protein